MSRLFAYVQRRIKAYFNGFGQLPHGSQDSLLFWIEENPNPRDTGTLTIACCGRILCEVHELALYSQSPEPVFKQIAAYSGDLRICPAKRIEFRNVSPWLQAEIRRNLADLQIL